MPKHVTMPLLAPLWITGKQDIGVAGSAHFRGDKLLSYGTVICQRVKVRGRTVYLLNESRYSDSTTRLQNLARAALHDAGAITVEVPGVGQWSSADFFDHKRILDALSAGARSLIEDSEGCREPKKARLRAEAKALLNRADQYRETFAVKGRKRLSA